MTRLGTAKLVILLSVACLLLVPGSRADDPLIGTKASDWEVTDWIHSQPLTLKDLAGKVVLIRWWTAPDCPYCAATAPALNEFHEQYKARGLVVLGFYHHKARTPLETAKVQRYAESFGFQFPVAIDRDWKTLRRWWLRDSKRSWTSVSFLIDRHGVIRTIHPGGEYVRGDRAYQTLKAKIEELLKET
ncbi:MAG TPA: TlpA disulfide reductase family protein [Gemmataceae bacterium]|nr:TlpA disulfide reductase family protein [Gemmataceae bacterium]